MRHYKNRKTELRPQSLFALRTLKDNPMLAAVAIGRAVEAKAEPAAMPVEEFTEPAIVSVPGPAAELDLLGQQFGRLTVTGRAEMPERKHKRSYWCCVCVCSREVTVRSDDLRSGRTYSCKDCRRSHPMRAIFTVVDGRRGVTKFGNG